MLMFNIEFSFQAAYLLMSFLGYGSILLLASVVVEGVIDEAIEFASCFFAGTVDSLEGVLDVAEEFFGILFCGRHDASGFLTAYQCACIKALSID